MKKIKYKIYDFAEFKSFNLEKPYADIFYIQYKNSAANLKNAVLYKDTDPVLTIEPLSGYVKIYKISLTDKKINYGNIINRVFCFILEDKGRW